MIKLLSFFFCAAWALGQPGLPQVILQSVNSPSIADTYANVAATACNSINAGQVAFTTDSVYTGRCTGSAWTWFFRGVSVTPPPTTSWTLDAAGGATTTANADGTVTFYFPKRTGGAGLSGVSGAYRTGAATQTITALACAVYGDFFFGSTDHADNSTDNNSSDILALRDSGGAYALFGFTAGFAAHYYSSLDYWTNSTTFSGTSFNYPNNAGAGVSSSQLIKLVSQDCHWFRIVEDSTNITIYTNYTGSANNWVQYIQKPKNDFLASGTHNPAIMMYTNNVGGRLTLISWLAQ